MFAKEESFQLKQNKIGNVYAWESLGSLIGGILFNFLLIWFFSTFQSLIILMIIGALIAALLSLKLKRFYLSGFLIAAVLVCVFFIFKTNPDKTIRNLAFQNQEITYNNDSPFGLFAITQQEDQTNYYENNLLIASSGDIVEKEESVHLAMIQHQNPKNILVLSGIINGILDEILKYPVQSIDYVDVNPEIIKIAQQKFELSNLNKINLFETDPLRFLKKSKKKYDVVLINLPKPSTLQLNRYYTYEFFKLLKKSLNHNAVISLSVPSSENYLSDEARKFISIIYKTLKSNFNHVLILPVSKDFLIASDSALTYAIAESTEMLNIPTEYVNAFYFDDELLKFRSFQILKQIDNSVSVNSDFNPGFYHSQIKLWMSHFNIKYWIPAVIIIIFSGFFFFRASIVYKGVYAAGFAGSIIELILLLVFQVLFGYVYAVAGIFIMIFMGGLAFGSYYLPGYFKRINRKTFNYFQFSIAIFAFVLPGIFILIKNTELNETVLFLIFIVLLTSISVLIGALFSIATKISDQDYGTIASNAYGLDLIGAATGALLFTIYVIPVLGLVWSVILVGLFNLIIAIISHSNS